MKYVKRSLAARWSGGTATLREGQSIGDDHPLVAERPDLFTDTEPEPDIKMPATSGRHGAPRVERATRAPGEVRKAGPRKRTTAKPDPDGA
ncbi:hypothetical protein [Streptomyces olivaceus]|uniref:hypothetical protein n=1 Tax=Streptomyces olivaceus TaxID=47716 RepID=UPI001CCE0802|nr:hypothetical protein [Streptomyces olivaceus]MBZ6135766.1 hypothetical protein [Streptomyces olivaceus]